MSQLLAQGNREKSWGAISAAVREQSILEKIIANSGATTGWTRNPIPTFERLTKAILEIDEPEFETIPLKLEVLKNQAESLLTAF
jgi:hypothetical protein